MNPSTMGDARKLFIAIRKSIIRKKIHATISIAAPYVYIPELEELSPSRKIELTAQDVFYEKKGTYTGEVSVDMLKSVSVTSVIVGHSERRTLGEPDEVILKKVLAALGGNLTTVVCVGEKKRDSHGNYFTFVEKQLRAFLSKIPKNKYKQLVIAYEPLWAISKGDGRGKNATAEDAHEMKLFIQKTIVDICGRKEIEKIRIIYGGSVNASNAKVFLTNGQMDGYLVGGASLKAEEFTKIIVAASEYSKK